MHTMVRMQTPKLQMQGPRGRSHACLKGLETYKLERVFLGVNTREAGSCGEQKLDL